MAEVLLDMPIMELLGSSETGGPQTTGIVPEFLNLLRSPGIDFQPDGIDPLESILWLLNAYVPIRAQL
jgi:hypothetical protein